MILVYGFNCTENFDILQKMCRNSKNLYNQALYTCIEAMNSDIPKYLSYYDLVEILKNEYNLEGIINYKLLKAQVSQQTIKLLSNSMKTYFSAIADYKNHPSKYTGRPRIPRYLPKDGYFVLTYTNQSSFIRDGYIFLSKNLKIRIPQFKKYKSFLSAFRQIRIIPKRHICEWKLSIIVILIQ